jgi:glutaconate CoA-transferase subunit B
MQVQSLHPGIELDQVKQATSFELEVQHPLAVTAPPNDRELCILREEVDPLRYVIGRACSKQ